jgi:pimeloyl-ACP methyl ester carboxylesterase
MIARAPGVVTQRAPSLLAAAVLVAGAVAARSRHARRIAESKNGSPPGLEVDDGVFLHVETDGAADAPVTVVFAHGFAARLQEYERQRAVLRDRARLVLFDQRGHGRSGWRGPSSATMERLGRDLGEIIDRFAGAGPVVVVGHSMGGMAVMALAEQRPELFGGKVVAVALLSTSAGQLVQSHLPPLATRLLLRTGIARACLWAAWLVAPLVDRLEPFTTSAGRAWLRKHLFGRVAPAELVSEMQDMWAYTSRSIGTSFYPGMVFHDGFRGLRALESVPALVLAGCADTAIPADHSVRLAKELGPAARLVLVPGAGHMVNMTHGRLVNRALLDLMARAEPGEAMGPRTSATCSRPTRQRGREARGERSAVSRRRSATWRLSFWHLGPGLRRAHRITASRRKSRPQHSAYAR